MPENKRRKPKKGVSKKATKATTSLIIVKQPKPRQIRISNARQLFLKAFEETVGNITASCKYAGINRATFYRWMNSKTRVNVKFQKQLQSLKPVERLLDQAEAVVTKHLIEGNLNAAIFVLKSAKAKHRGYSDKFEVTIQTDAEFVRLKKRIQARANQRGVSFAVELETYLEIFGSDIRPEIKEKLTWNHIN